MAGWAKLMQSDAGACAGAVATSKIQQEVGSMTKSFTLRDGALSN